MGLEAALQVGGRRLRHGRRAEESGRADPDVQAAECVEQFVDEHERLVLLRHVEWIRGDLGVGVLRVDAIDEAGVLVCAGALVAGYWSC